MRSAPTLPARIQSWTPCRDGMSPVRTDARAGEHTGDVQKKSVKRMPEAAMPSSAGVMISSLPAQRIAHGPWSSLRMKRTLGRCASLLAIVIVPGIRRPRRPPKVASRHHDPAVHVERGTGGEVAIVRRDEERHARDLLDGAEALERRARIDAGHDAVERHALHLRAVAPALLP